MPVHLGSPGPALTLVQKTWACGCHKVALAALEKASKSCKDDKPQQQSDSEQRQQQALQQDGQQQQQRQSSEEQLEQQSNQQQQQSGQQQQQQQSGQQQQQQQGSTFVEVFADDEPKTCRSAAASLCPPAGAATFL